MSGGQEVVDLSYSQLEGFLYGLRGTVRARGPLVAGNRRHFKTRDVVRAFLR
jgi:hypothetical protein